MSAELAPSSTGSRIPDPFETPVLSIPEAGKLLGLKRHAAYGAAKRGEIPTRPLGRKTVVPTAELLVLVGLWTGEGQPRDPAWSSGQTDPSPANESNEDEEPAPKSSPPKLTRRQGLPERNQRRT